MAGKLILKGANSGYVEFTAPDSGTNTTVNAGLLVYKDSENGTVAGTSTNDIPEGSNLYYTTARFDSDFATKDLHDSVAVQAQIDATIASTDTHDSVAVQAQIDSALPVALASDVSLGNITTTGYIRGPATFEIDPSAHGDETGTLRVRGNLTVEGTTTTINSTTVETSDLALALAKDAVDSAACDGAGITVVSATANFTYDHTNSAWNSNKDLTVDGDVGIGTTSPDSKLDVRGTILGGASAPSTGQIAFGVQYGGSTNIPNTYGTMKSSAATVIGWGVYGGVTQDTFVSSVDTSLNFKRGALVLDQDELKFYNGAQQLLARDASATMTERMRLTDAGVLHVDNNVVAYSTTVSDIRLKENVEVVEGAVDKIQQLRGVTFDRKDTGKRSAGVIAQELEEVLPEAITETELPLKEGFDEVYKTVEYDALHALLIEAVKELKAEIEELKGNQ